MRSLALVSLVSLVSLGACHHAAAPSTEPAPQPAVASCAQVAAHARDLVQPNHEDHIDFVVAIAKVTLDRCTADHWSDAARRCVMAAKDEDRGKRCLDVLPEPQRTAFLADLDRQTAPADKPEPPVAPDVTDPSGLPRECLEYRAKLMAYADCAKLPDDARKQMKDAFQQAWQQWEQIPEEGKASLAAACKSAVDAVATLTCP